VVTTEAFAEEIAEAAELAAASGGMLAVAFLAVVAGQALGSAVHQRAAQPGMTWSQAVVGAAHTAGRIVHPLRRRRPTRVDASAVTVAAVRSTTVLAGVALGLIGVTVIVGSGQASHIARFVAAAALLAMLGVLAALLRSRSRDVRAILARRGVHLVAGATMREFASTAAMTLSIWVVVHTAGIVTISAFEVVAVVLVTRLVMVVVPIPGSPVIADVTLVVGLAWMGAPLAVGLGALLIWRLGSLVTGVLAGLIVLRTDPVPYTASQPSRDGPGWLLHRALFGVVAVLPAPLRDRLQSRLFDAMFAMSSDPWGYQESSYEERKRAALVSAVGADARFIVEVGCADGHNLLALAARYPDAVIVGTDISDQAVRIARERVRAHPRVQVVSGADPAALRRAVPGPIDCLVLSEVLYYLGSTGGIARSLEVVRELLHPQARVVMLHGSADAAQLHSRAADALGIDLIDDRVRDDLERPFRVAVGTVHHAHAPR
jgi:uncharacterized membrane protein YbhN (UPF0104 family)